MSRNPQLDRWLAAEQQDDGTAAEEAFAAVFQTLPRVEPGDRFATLAAAAVRRARARRRVIAVTVRAAVAVVVGVAGLAVAYASSGLVLGALVRALVWGSEALAWVFVTFNDGMTWWAVAARAGASLTGALGSPASILAVVAAEAAAASALYLLGRLLDDEGRLDGAKEART